ncbi:DUF5694 domain-containing protein [Flavobacterium sp. RSP29]|uniref:DUF5694 domain-containing protein n=1 Tax=Flavobacterium sp. RSP29 TaxID=3401731 RepID=UPI003AAC7A70
MKLNSVILVVSLSLVSISFFAQNKILDSNSKIKVLNVGTFHMSETNDATKTEFNEDGVKEQAEIRKLNEMIAKFKPTIICVEITPENQDGLNLAYQEYLKTAQDFETNWSEVSLVAFEVGRLSNVKKLYGIDHKMGYNYTIGEEIVNTIDSVTYRNYVNNPLKESPELSRKIDHLSLIDKMRTINNPKYQDFLLNINADILTYVGTEKGYEGADEASKLYKRNLRMFSNINRIPMNENDRVFILSGGLHASFFADFMKRSPKYELVPISNYLK